MRTKDEKKQTAIRNAAIAEFVRNGLGGASVAQIAKSAGVSPATIYIYYPNKNEMLVEVYLEAKVKLRESIVAAIDPAADSAANIRNMWFALYDHLVASPNDFVFLEYVATANLLSSSDQTHARELMGEATAIIQQAVSEGTIRATSIDAIQSLLVAPALHLAKQQVSGRSKIDRAVLDATFTMVWAGLTAPQKK